MDEAVEREHCEESARMSFPSVTVWERKCLVALLLAERGALRSDIRDRAQDALTAYYANADVAHLEDFVKELVR